MDGAPADPLVGTTVAQYEVVARLGGGGMGVVYAARDTRLGRRVALKFLPPEWSRDDSAKQRFIREAQAASATDHPNICTIHDIGTADDGQLFIVMAHYDGETLKERLERGALAVDEAVHVAAQVAEGLAKAHAQGVVHRDIKPGNLMLTEDGVRVLDFGLAKFADARLKLTLEGSTIGTVAYMSPEQIRGEDADARSDVWAVGVVLYEMLAGRPPFRGGYHEAIGHAIRHEPPAPLRTGRVDISEALEQLVFRALHKDPAVRFQSTRDLARALRGLQGRTLPLELRTEVLPAMDRPPGGLQRARSWHLRRGLTAAAVIALLAGIPLWLLSPVDRIPVMVAPVVNQTGNPDLERYRLALTQELVHALERPGLSTVPYDRLLLLLEPYRSDGRDVSSREVMQALTNDARAPVIVVPTILYDNGAWTARVEFRDRATATSEGTFATPGVVSSLTHETIYALIPLLARGIDEYFAARRPLRARAAAALTGLMGRTRAAPDTPRFANLEAARAFEEGSAAYQRFEYAAALQAFEAAATEDPRSPLPAAWRARVAWLMRQDARATDAADRAINALTAATSPIDRLFVEAVAAEARRDPATAEARYRGLVAAAPSDAWPLMELGGFQDRRAANADAIATYHAALMLDDRLLRADVDLCRMYNRVNEAAQARERGGRALEAARSLRSIALEAQASFCLSDALRVGTDAERREARALAERAFDLLQRVKADYQLSRAAYYVGLAAAEQGDLLGSVAWSERALAMAQTSGNAVLQPLLLMNLGAAHERLGNGLRAAGLYRDSSLRYQQLGDELRAAQIQANSANLRIEFGDPSPAALRDLDNALAVVRKLGDRDFEVFCLHALGTYERYTGQVAEAERDLNRAIAIAAERDLDQKLAQISVELGRLRLDTGQYATARDALMKAVSDGAGRYVTQARIYLGRLYARTRDLPAAAAALQRAAGDVASVPDAGVLRPQLEAALGELAYESGRSAEARVHFTAAKDAAAANPASETFLESQAYLGSLDMREGRIAQGRRHIQRTRDASTAAGKTALAARVAALMR